MTDIFDFPPWDHPAYDAHRGKPKPSTKFRHWVFPGNVEVDRTTTHKVRLTCTPMYARGVILQVDIPARYNASGVTRAQQGQDKEKK